MVPKAYRTEFYEWLDQQFKDEINKEMIQVIYKGCRPQEKKA